MLISTESSPLSVRRGDSFNFESKPSLDIARTPFDTTCFEGQYHMSHHSYSQIGVLNGF